MTYGRLYAGNGETYTDGTKARSALFLREHVGDLSDNEGGGYDLETDFGTRIPIITSRKTGRKVVFDWETLVKLAIKRGIDDNKPLPPEKP